ncbi:DUF1156 domain-containing protein [Kamptonema formosum]|uniref:DUF1156 domain-containing protein n=1 Tax=Kamptonema formosum TaxID=331992 RepID=UPI00034C4D63|nr:DUF1156 domain-containing protein [Oscillatoria sp. PCC 10802]
MKGVGWGIKNSAGLGGAGEGKAIEEDSFPFEQLSEIAELESWRKEINRPLYYIHKWWARRLGSVFRAIILSTFAPEGSDILSLFYKPASLKGVKVFDPFMGSELLGKPSNWAQQPLDGILILSLILRSKMR